MSLQSNTGITNAQKEILDLEKRYFDLLFKIVNSDSFKTDLLNIEREISDRYHDYANVWNLKNKLKNPAERLVLHHMYTNPLINNKITGLYTSAVSSDIGLQTEDVVLCVDVKTNDLIGNRGDHNRITAEKNQISFANTNYPLVNTTANLDKNSRYKPHNPILTYVVKIGYADDGTRFNLVKSDLGTFTIQVACVPNGNLGSLFNNNILTGFKTYSYKDEVDPNPSFIKYYPDKDTCIQDLQSRYSLIPNVDKEAYRDISTGKVWVATTKARRHCARIITSGSTARLNTDILTNRLDSTGAPWVGYKTITY